ncbi:hypothetical protein CK500_07200 [Halorubrum salipaludis]|uniref:TRASH domain-containing protein n=1 Tax=Halorubrum salipaludis TaxID=2032630 RepID=A0A2A2FHU1_9EURY|nr:hypothetical protein [Halorubrum salipaludis]PAU84212.1 hypothetical protein CK500_07200 [Halorubrum salipaludis]
MVDPTSGLEEDVDEESAPRCATCGEPALGTGRRTVTWVDGDDAVHRQFCSQACRDEWTDERPSADG